VWRVYEHDAFWVLLEGSVRLESSPGAEEGVRLVPGDFFGSFAGSDGGAADVNVVALERVVVATLPQRAFADILDVHRDLAGVREGFERDGLMLTKHVFAGNGRLPGGFVRLKKVFG
jgi:hypothetical protein